MAKPIGPIGTEISPFAKAIEEFIIETSTKENEKSEFYKQVLREVNSGSVRRNLQEENALCAQRLTAFIEGLQVKHHGSKVVRLSNRLQSLCAGLNQFTAAFDVLIQAGPSAAVLIYGGARLILHLAQNFNSIFDTVVGVLDDIGHDLQCYNLFAKAYCSSPDVQERLVESYKRIISFWQELSKLLTKKTGVIFSRSLIQPVTSKWQKCKDALREDRERIQLLVMAVEADQRLQRAEALEREATETRRQEDLTKVAEWIRSHHLDQDLDHAPEARKQASERHPSTCQWIMDHPVYNQWLSAGSGSVILVGPPGTGKTMWSSTVFQDLEARGLKVATFSFSYNDSEQSNSMTALRAIALCLLRFFDYVPDSVQDLHKKDVARHIIGIKDPDMAVDLIRALCKQISRVHIIVDGLDECVGPQRKQLLALFEKLLTPDPYGGIAKWLFTSREYPDIVNHFQKCGTRSLHASKGDLEPDIRTYLAGTMKSELDWECQHCIDRLTTKAEGNFMWASLTMKFLKVEFDTFGDDLQVHVEDFPSGLTACYLRSLKHLKHREKSERERARNLFHILVAAEQPLRLSEMAQALGAMSLSRGTSNKYRSNDLLCPSSAAIKDLCSGLVVFDTVRGSADDPLLRFAHKSVQDFFLEDPQVLEAPPFTESFFTTLDDARHMLGMACLQYLTLERYDRVVKVEELLQDSKNAFIKHAAIFWFRYIEDIPPSQEIFTRVQAFLQGASVWTCVAVQSRIAPHLFGRFIEQDAGFYSLESFDLSYQDQQRVNYGVPLPSWLHAFNDDGERIFKDFYTFIKQWHVLLNAHHLAVQQSIMDDEWNSRYPYRGPWCSKRATVTNIASTQPLTAEKRSPSFTRILSVDKEAEHKFSVLTFERHPESDVAGGDLIYWTIEGGHASIQGKSKSSYSQNHQEAARYLPLVAYTSKPRKSCKIEGSRTIKLDMEDGTMELDRDAQSLSYRPLKQGRAWSIINGSVSNGIFDPCSGPGVMALHGSYNTDDDGEAPDLESDEESSQSGSDYGSIHSDEVDHDTQRIDLPHEIQHNRSVLFIPPGKTHLWSTWYSKYPADTTLCAFHPAKNLMVWSPQAYEARVADLENGEVSSIPLPEPVGFQWRSVTTLYKELKFSDTGDVLHYLLYTAEQTDTGMHQMLSVSSYKFSSGADGYSLTQLRSVGPIESYCLGHPESSFIVPTWTSRYVHIAIPPLFCDAKILRLSLDDTLDSEDIPAAEFEILKDQIYFPSNTLDRNPRISVFHGDGEDELVLSLDGEVMSPSDALPDAATNPPQPPAMMTWKIKQVSDWRRWDRVKDPKSSHYLSYEDSYQRLRGSYVDSSQRFTVQICSGLDFTRKAFVTCS